MSGRATLERVTASVEQTWALGAAVGRACHRGDVVLLEGELGAGKTQLVRGMADGMGLDATHVASPTFVLMREYEGDGGALLVHVDAYRLGSADELVEAGFDEELRAAGVTAVEWPSRVAGLFDAADPAVIAIAVEHADTDHRRVTVDAEASRLEAIRLASGDE
ncbi:MAG: tRNA (adenosine(37)-N6)-threonylcarbamoyltransferase complex ATPase subunit type 1 TsaE [Planctomycetota bacterium]